MKSIRKKEQELCNLLDSVTTKLTSKPKPIIKKAIPR